MEKTLLEGTSYTFGYLTPEYTWIMASIRYGKHRLFENTSEKSSIDRYIVDVQ